jgi:hypothetical protein
LVFSKHLQLANNSSFVRAISSLQTQRSIDQKAKHGREDFLTKCRQGYSRAIEGEFLARGYPTVPFPKHASSRSKSAEAARERANKQQTNIRFNLWRWSNGKGCPKSITKTNLRGFNAVAKEELWNRWHGFGLLVYPHGGRS